MSKKECEIWKDVPGHENKYMVSSLGRYKAKTNKVVDKNGREMTFKSRMLDGCFNGSGYIMVQRGKKQDRLHRIVAGVFVSNPNNKKCVNHKDGNKTNNKASNLEWCTRKENIEHAFRTGLTNNSGSNNGHARLTEGSVSMIKHVHKYTGQKQLANHYNVAPQTINSIIKERSWKQVK